MRDPSEHLAALQKLVGAKDSPHPVIVALMSDYSSAFGYIEGLKIGMDRLAKDAEFWRSFAMDTKRKSKPRVPGKGT